MLTYPLPAATLNVAATTVQVAAFLKSPTMIARRFAEILAAQNFLAHFMLTGRYRMEGGAVVYYPDEAIVADSSPETINPGGNYPMIVLEGDTLAIVAAMKKGFGTEVSDESVGRALMDPVERAIMMLANTIVTEFDSVAVAAIQSQVTATEAVTAAWTTATAPQIIGDVARAKAAIANQRKGYRANAVVLTEDQWATALPALLSVLPRESGQTLTEGAVPRLLGLDWVTSENLPANWNPLVLDNKNLGGIGHEDIPSPEYVALSAVAEGNGSGVEVARFRETNDSTKIQVRKADVPVVRNPGAAVEITGAGV